MKIVKKRVLTVLALFCAVSVAVFAGITTGEKNIAANAEVVPTTDTFETIGTSVRLGDKSGLRFTTYVNADYLESIDQSSADYEFGTLIIPTAILGENELDVDTATANKVPTEYWGQPIKDGEDNVLYYTYHAVLTDIPETDYATAITAKPYVVINGAYTYNDDVLENNIANVAAIAINSGDYNEDPGALANLKDYIDTATGGTVSFAAGSYRTVPTIPSGVTLDAVAAYEKVYIGGTIDLDLTESYPAIWTSSDENVATVNQNGLVTGVAQGVATITATLGSNSATYRVAVVPESTEITGGTLEPTVQERKYVNNSDTFVASGDFDIYVKASETAYSNGIYSVTNLKSQSGFRFYSDEFDGLNAKDKVSVTITYKYINAKNSTAGSLITPSNDISYDSNKGYATNSLTANAGTWSTLTFDAYISNAAADYITLNGIKDQNRYASGNDSEAALAAFNAMYNGDNDNNIQFAFQIDRTAGSHLEIKSIGITPAYTQAVTTEQVIDAGSVNIVSALGISGVKGTLSYTVTDKDGANIAVSNGAFTATAQNYYDVTVTATNAAGNTYTNGTTVRLIVKDTCMAVSGATVTESAGTLTLTSTADWSKYRFFLDGLEDYNVGDIVYVTMTYRVNVPSNAGQRLFIVGKGDAQVDQTLFGTGDSGVVTKVFPAAVCTSNYDYAPLTSITGTNAKHIKITTLFYDNSGKKSVYPVTMTVSNIALAPYFDLANTEATINASSQIDIASVAGITGVQGEMSYTITDKNGANVTVTNGKFTSGAAQNYYDITATATLNGDTCIKTTRFIVKDTYMAKSGYSAVEYGNSGMTVTKADNNSLTTYRLYIDGLENYNVGDMVTVKMNYTANVPNATQKFLVLTQKTGDNYYPAISNSGNATICFAAVVCTADQDYPAMLGGLTTLEGSSAKHVKIETWFYKATSPAGHVTGTFTINSAELVNADYGCVENVTGNISQSLTEDGNVLINVISNSECRFYFTDLANFNAGDTVAVTLKYKYNYTATAPDAQSRCFYGPVSSSAYGLLVPRGTLVCDGQEHTVTFNTAVSNTAGSAGTDTSKIVGGTNAKNLIIQLWLTAGTTFEITDVTIAAT